MKFPFHHSTAPGAAEFYLRRSGNVLLVQTARSGEVTICATADNLTPEQREAFVRYLRAEGFIAADPESLAELVDCKWREENPSARWIVDAAWPSVDPTYARHIQRLCAYTLGVLTIWLSCMIAFVCF